MAGRTNLGEQRPPREWMRTERVIVTQRNAAEQIEREIEIERTWQGDEVRQTTVRVTGYDTLTSEAHEPRAMVTDMARVLIAEAEQRGMLTRPGITTSQRARARAERGAC